MAALVEEIKSLLTQARLEEAFQLVIRLKSRREPLRGLDGLRAECFLRKGMPYAAIEALREELRYFPDNQTAAMELERLLGLHGAEPAVGDAKFRELVRAVRSRTMLSGARLLSLYTLARQVCEEDMRAISWNVGWRRADHRR
jgi:O-methyltransferase